MRAKRARRPWRSIRFLGTALAFAAVAIIAAPVVRGVTPVTLTPITTDFNNPIGIDHHVPTNKVVLSVNYPFGTPRNFELVASDGSHSPFSTISGFTDEVKIATVKDTLGGFVVGTLFTGNGVPGQIARIAPDGSSFVSPWVTLPAETGLMRGSLYVDRTGVWGGDLIVVTTTGGVWRVTSGGTPTFIRRIPTHLEGLTTVPNDPGRYGPWAGKILAGAEALGLIYSIDTAGNATSWPLGINPEDFDLIPENQNFFGVGFADHTLYGAGPAQWADKVGDLLVTQESPGILWHVRWNPATSAFEKTELVRVGQWEHVTFSTAGVNQIPPIPVCPAPVHLRCASPAGETVTLPIHVEDPDGDALTVSWEVDSAVEQVDNVPGTTPPPTTADLSFTHTYLPGAHGVKVTVDDGNNHPTSCTTSVTIETDTTPPTVACPQLAPVVAGPGCLAIVPAVQVQPTDDCSGPGELVVSQDPAAGTAVGPGLHAIQITVTDEAGNAAQCTSTFEVRSDNPPTATDDVYRLDGDGPLAVPAPGVLGNDTAGGDGPGPLTATLLTDPAHGTVTLNPDGSFTYARDPGFRGVDSFTYEVEDGGCGSARATVTIRPPLDCEELFGIDLGTDTLIAIDPGTAQATPIGTGLGIAVDTVGADFAPDGTLWAFSAATGRPGVGVLYTVDLMTGLATVVKEFDISAVGTGVGLEFGPDGKTLYWISGTHLSILDVATGTVVPVVDDLGFSSVSLTLPARCTDFFSVASGSGRLMRVSSVDGATSEAGDTGLPGINSLAATAQGTIYGHAGGQLYVLEGATFTGTLVGPIVDASGRVRATAGMAFRPAFSREICLDERFNRRTRLSRWVVDINRHVRHVDPCHGKHHRDDCDRCHGKDCDVCQEPDDKCSRCGAPGFYVLDRGGVLVFETPALPTAGLYRLEFQVKAPFGPRHTRGEVRIGDAVFPLDFTDEWRWTDPILARLEAGVNRIVVRSTGKKPFKIEGVRIHRDCPRLCESDLKACLDKGLRKKTGLSDFVTLIEGKAGHVHNDGCCGHPGHYFVARETGRIVAELDVPVSGHYLFRFSYRIGARHADQESVRVVIGGRSFDFLDEQLKNTRVWETSEPVEVQLEAGPNPIEFVSIGKDVVRLEKVKLELVCECGPVGTTGPE